MLLRIVQMVIGNIFVTVATIHFYRLLRTRIAHLDIPLFTFLWIYITTLYTFVLGLARLLEPNKIAIISLVGLIVLAAPYWKDYGRWLGHLCTFFRRLWHFRPSLLDALLLFLGLIELGRIAVHVWYIPPYMWDAMTYHLPNVAEWVQKERIYTITAATARTNWQATLEVFETWFAVFLHHDLLIELAGVAFWVLVGTSVYAIARTLNFSYRLSIFAALLYLYTPLVSLCVTDCGNDLPLAGPFLLCVVFALALLQHGFREKFQPGHLLLILVMAFSYGVGLKAVAVFIAPGLLLLGFVALIKQHPVRDFLRLFWPRKDVGKACVFRMVSRGHLTLMVFVILSSALLGGYWYFRNWLLFDNPFHPVDFSLFGHLIFGTGRARELFGFTQQGHFSLSRMWLNLQALVSDNIFDRYGPMHRPLHHMSGWGWFSFACGLPALAYAVLFVKGFRLLSVAFVLSLLSLFAWVDNPGFMRFTPWFPALFALSFVALIRVLTSRLLKVPIIALAVFCTLLNFAAMLNVGLFSVSDFPRMKSIPALERSTANLLDENLDHFYDSPMFRDWRGVWFRHRAFRDALAHIPKGETIAVCIRENAWVYPLYDSDFSRHLIFFPLTNQAKGTVSDSFLEFVYTMKRHNVKYLFVAGLGQQIAQQAMQDGVLTKLTNQLYTSK